MRFPSKYKRGFTLLELLVSVSISIIILSVVVLLVSRVSSSWREGRAKLETNKEARNALNVLSRDLESIIIRDSPTDAAWLEVNEPIPVGPDGVGLDTGNSQALYFFSPITDLETAVDNTADATGTLAGIRYVLAYQDPISIGDAQTGDLQLFGLYRDVRPPSEVYGAASGATPLVGQADLEAAFGTATPEQNEFLARDIIDFTLSYLVENADGETLLVPPGTFFRVTSEGIDSTLAGLGEEQGVGARLIAIQINLTVLDERGSEIVRQLEAAGEALTSRFPSVEDFLVQHGRNYSQQVNVYSY